MKTITYNPETHKLVPIEPDYKILVEIAHAKTATRNGIKAPMTNEELASIYKAGISAASAAEEVPQQEPDRTGMTYYKNDACKAKDANASDCICWTPKQQPATHGEPVEVARVDDLERGGRVRALAMGLSLDAPLYTAPQPTPELVQAAKQALEALIIEQSAIAYEKLPSAPHVDDAIKSLQRILKSTAAPNEVTLRWCNYCGEGYVGFCRGKTEKCPMKESK